MKFAVTYLAASAAAAGFALAFSVSPASSADDKTWYVYCEGNGHGDHWAVFSENFWPHPLTEGYGRQVGSAAKAFFESRHNMQLDGCAAVNFVNFSLAEYSRSRTAQLHKKMGDRVFFFQLPDEALPVMVATPAPVSVGKQADDESAATAPAVARAPETTEPTSTFTPRRPDR